MRNSVISSAAAMGLTGMTGILSAGEKLIPVSPPCPNLSFDPTIQPILRVLELNIGESANITLHDGSQAKVKLLQTDTRRDSLNSSVRTDTVTLEVNGQKDSLVATTYNLPKLIGGVQVDAPITKSYLINNSYAKDYGLEKDVRLRLWPKNSPWIQPGTFMMPIRQRLFCNYTQMANEPVYVDGGEVYQNKDIYYHYGLDFGGVDYRDEIVAATDGIVISHGMRILDAKKIDVEIPSQVEPRYDVIYLRDHRGWFYRYSHLNSIDPAIKLGREVKMGQRLGFIGRQGGSGGWCHLHFDITAPQPGGLWGFNAAFPFVWQAYLQQYKPKLIALARPHHVAMTGETITLDGSKSWAEDKAGIQSYEWTFCDDTKAQGPKTQRQYTQPGTYSEILKITDAAGNIAYDFNIVQVFDKDNPKQKPGSIHLSYHPNLNVQPGQNIAFKVRNFGNDLKCDQLWDFADGSPTQTTQHDPANACMQNIEAYRPLSHSFDRPGHYIVTVTTQNQHGYPSIGRLWVPVGA